MPQNYKLLLNKKKFFVLSDNRNMKIYVVFVIS